MRFKKKSCFHSTVFAVNLSHVLKLETSSLFALSIVSAFIIDFLVSQAFSRFCHAMMFSHRG